MALVRIGSLTVTCEEDEDGTMYVRFTIPTIHSTARLTLEQTDTLLEKLRKDVTRLKRKRGNV